MTVEHVKVGSRKLIVITPASYTRSENVKDDSQSNSQMAVSHHQQEGNVHGVLSRLTGGLVCKDCGKVFSAQCYLDKHRRIHMGGKPFNCDLCDKQFTQACHVKRHMSTHTEEKPFTCEICMRSFARKHQLKGHMSRKHKVNVHSKKWYDSCRIQKKKIKAGNPYAQLQMRHIVCSIWCQCIWITMRKHIYKPRFIFRFCYFPYLHMHSIIWIPIFYSLIVTSWT